MSYTISSSVIPYVFTENHTFAVGSNYGEDVYNSSTYNGESSRGSSGGGFLGQTGTSILLVTTISAVVFFCSLLTIILRRKTKNRK